MSPIKFLNVQELFVNPVSIYLRKPYEHYIFLQSIHTFFHCNLVWASTYRTNLIRLEILQKRVIRTIAKTTFADHTDPVFQNLGILKFHDIYLIQLGLFMYSYQNHTLPLKFHCKFTLQSQIHSYNTRNSCKFCLPFCRTRTKQFSVFYQGPKFYNTLTPISSTPPHLFPLKEHLRHLFVIIISILQQKSYEKAF